MGGFQQRYSEEDIFKGANFGDLFRDLGFGGGDIFSMIFGRQAGRAGRQRSQSYDFGDYITREQQAPRDLDLNYELEIPFMDAIRGTEKSLLCYPSWHRRSEYKNTPRNLNRQKT